MAELSLADVARLPLPGMAHPDGFSFSHDDTLLAWLADPDGGLVNALWVRDTGADATSRLLCDADDPAAATASSAAALRRERLRRRATGIADFQWARRSHRLLVPAGDDLLVVDAGSGARTAVPTGGSWFDPVLSPDETHVAFVRDGEVWAAPVVPGAAARALTWGDPRRARGVAEYVAQEELDRYTGFWWAPGSRHLAVCEVDETAVSELTIVHQGDLGSPPSVEQHRYPFTGTANAIVRLGVFGLDEHTPPVWIDLPPLGGDAGGYLARVEWLGDGTLAAQILDRRQRRLGLYRCDPTTGAAAELVVEESATWVNVHDCFRPVGDAGAFVWASERGGFRHLELRDADGTLARTLTRGGWEVTGVRGVDADSGRVLFTATADGVCERHLYEVGFGGGEPRRVTPEHGWHDVTVDHACRHFVDVHHSLASPPTVRLRRVVDASVVAVLHETDDARIEALALAPPELVEVTARDGTALHGAVYRPDGAGPHPTVVRVYGGPQAQMVGDAWALTVDLRAQWLRRQGVCVFVLDNRGSLHRGMAFEAAVAGDLGNLEVRDQVDGVAHLVERGITDAERVGVYGWSYGGYLAAMCLARAPEVFRAAVAGAPVTRWEAYDTCYTERYMGLLAGNEPAYERSAVTAYVDAIRGDLLVVHGMVDENVHFRHTALLVDALTRAGVEYDLLVFPGERHMPRGEADRLYMEQRIAAWLLERLR
ncbi:MAG: DPP IV N-terminal domain-containing protein [Acidimicrobiia bacterium]